MITILRIIKRTKSSVHGGTEGTVVATLAYDELLVRVLVRFTSNMLLPVGLAWLGLSETI